MVPSKSEWRSFRASHPCTDIARLGLRNGTTGLQGEMRGNDSAGYPSTFGIMRSYGNGLFGRGMA